MYKATYDRKFLLHENKKIYSFITNLKSPTIMVIIREYNAGIHTGVSLCKLAS